METVEALRATTGAILTAFSLDDLELQALRSEDPILDRFVSIGANRAECPACGGPWILAGKWAVDYIKSLHEDFTTISQ